jgi:hypothetical protein
MGGNAVTSRADGHGAKNYSIMAKLIAPGKTKQHFKNWMEPGANQNRLVYASDFNNSIVQVYNYPSNGTQNPPAGTLTGFLNPQGMCVDKSNNLYIADTGNSRVQQYQWGSSSPSASYPATGEYPVGCSVDPTTGNLAASDIFSPTTGQGAVTICSSPSSCTTYVEPGGLLECFFIGYAPNGDLYVDGENSFGFGLAYLPAGSSTWQAGSVSGETINFPGGIMYDNTNMTVTDQSGSLGNPVLYQCSASGSTLDCSGGTQMSGSTDVTGPFVKRGAKGMVGADVNGTIYTWAYPAGGTPRPGKTITVSESYPSLNGQAVQLGP